jgi:hypothetical protein
MANNVLIKIEQENKTEAEFMSRSFVDKSIKNRAYINALGAELVMKYLSENGIDVSELHNMHSISKVLERVDIADILLPNIHIDARVVFEEDKIFIPKSHFELKVQPDIYVVVKLNDNFESVELLGYVESDKIDFKKSNEDYYFIEKDALDSVDSLANYVKNFDSNREKLLDEEDMLKGREMSISMADHDISDSDFKELLSMLLRSDSLRNSLLEFDNFELLSYNAVAFLPDMDSVSPEDLITEDAETIKDFEEDFKTFSEDDDMNEISESIEKDIDADSETETPFDENMGEVLDTEISEENSLDYGETSLGDSSNNNSDSNIGGIIATGAGIAGGAAALAAGAAGIAGAAESASISAAANAASAVGSVAADAIKMGGAVTDEAMELAGMSGTTDDIELSEEVDTDLAEDNSELSEEDLSFTETEEEDASLAEDNSELAEEDLSFTETEEVGTNLAEDNLELSEEDLSFTETEEVGTNLAEDNSELSEEDLSFTETEEVGTNLAEDNSELAEDVSSFEEESETSVVSDSIDSEAGESDLNTEDIEISEEVFDGDDTIAGISDDFGNTVEGEALPEDSDIIDSDSEKIEISDENSDVIELAELDQGDEESMSDDIFSQFVQESDEQGVTGVAADDYQENVTSFADLEAASQFSVSTPDGAEDTALPMEELKATSNSTVISDKNFSVGEIPIDINASQIQEPIQEELEGIYNPEYSDNNDSVLNNNVRIVKNNPNSSNSIMKILGGLVALVVIGAIGFAAFKFMKPANQPEPIVDNYVPEEIQKSEPEDPNTLQVDQNKIVEMNKKSAAASNSAAAPAAVRQSRPISATSYINVSKISWEVPDYVSYSPAFRQYFQSAGRSLKLALTSDLLLSTEYAYSNQVKVSVSFDRSGAFKESRIVQSSGSSQVDRIVLQTVNQTLSVLKSPASLRDDENTTVILKIYF